jgi:peptidylamidoglycolate lyase
MVCAWTNADNVWVTDIALQQVLKFSRDGRLMMTVGEEGVPGQEASIQ